MPISYIAKHKGVSNIQTVNEIIEYLIKNQDEIADIVVSYQTHADEVVIVTNVMDMMQAVGLVSYTENILINRDFECGFEYELEDGE